MHTFSRPVPIPNGRPLPRYSQHYLAGSARKALWQALLGRRSALPGAMAGLVAANASGLVVTTDSALIDQPLSHGIGAGEGDTSPIGEAPYLLLTPQPGIRGANARAVGPVTATGLRPLTVPLPTVPSINVGRSSCPGAHGVHSICNQIWVAIRFEIDNIVRQILKGSPALMSGRVNCKLVLPFLIATQVESMDLV